MDGTDSTYPWNWTTSLAKGMLGSVFVKGIATWRIQYHPGSLHIAPVGADTDFYFQRYSKLVHAFHLFAHQLGEFLAFA
jgi:hypothetical protein